VTCDVDHGPNCPGGGENCSRAAYRYEGKELLSLSRKMSLPQVSGNKIAMVFQEPAKYLNPASLWVTQYQREMVMRTWGSNRSQADMRGARELLGLVRAWGGRQVLGAYPHELTSGMKQRAMIAIAISCNPDFLIAGRADDIRSMSNTASCRF
jgi:ABC-type dipeptide/oligopeptide/nickel transport system ATPase component